MRVGDIVIHQLNGKRMKILHLSETGLVAGCEQLDEPDEWEPRLQVMRKPRAVCLMKNLIPEPQLNLFK
jgi:hypothetical protein